MILWTCLHPEQFDPNKSLTVQVATDMEFADIVFEGAVTDEIRIKSHDYTIKVDLDGRLESDTEFTTGLYTIASHLESDVVRRFPPPIALQNLSVSRC